MKTNSKIIIAVLVIIVIGAGYYLASGNSSYFQGLIVKDGQVDQELIDREIGEGLMVDLEAKLEILEGEELIDGYRRCITNGVMKGLPTRIIPNCISELSLKSDRWAASQLLNPNEIVVQRFFDTNCLVLNAIRAHAVAGNKLACERLVEQAVSYELSLWERGLMCMDTSFNVFENLLVLPNGCLQLHDAYVTSSTNSINWFLREKRKDLASIAGGLTENYPRLLYKSTSVGSISESARKLYHALPPNYRDDLVMLFFDRVRELMTEDSFQQHWNKNNKTPPEMEL